MARELPPAANGTPYHSNFAIVPFSRTYDEAFTLLVEARNYLSAHRCSARNQPNDRQRIDQFLEEMRMTSRLIRSMAWLLSVRAVEEGELGWADVIDSDNLMVDLKVCADELRNLDETLMPPALLDLMRRAHSLYMRTARMELQVAARHAG